MSNSPIWQAEIRDEVSIGKWSSGKLNKLRSDLLVPGFDQQLLEKVNTVIPVLFIQRPGTLANGVKLSKYFFI